MVKEHEKAIVDQELIIFIFLIIIKLNKKKKKTTLAVLQTDQDVDSKFRVNVRLY